MGCFTSKPNETQDLQQILYTQEGLWQVRDVNVLIVPANESLREDITLNRGMDKAIGNSNIQIEGEKSKIPDDGSPCKTYLVSSQSGNLEQNNRINQLCHYVRKGQFSQTSTSSIMLEKHLTAIFELCKAKNYESIGIPARLPGTDSLTTLQCADIYKSVIRRYPLFKKITILCDQNNLVEFKNQYQSKKQANQSMIQQQAQGPFISNSQVQQDTSQVMQTDESNVVPSKLKILVEQENIVNLRDVDVIVNPANSNLRESAGLCGEIYNACGTYELETLCTDYREQFGQLKTSQVVVTTSCKLVQQRIKSIIHVVAPDNLTSEDSEQQLHDCVMNVLKECFINLKYASIAIPAIGSGSQDFRYFKCAQIYLLAIEQFQKEHSEVFGLVRLTNKDQITYEAFKDVFRKYL